MASKKRFYVVIGISFWLLTAVFALLPSWPHFYYRLSPQASSRLASTIASTAASASQTLSQPAPTPTSTQISPVPSPSPVPTLPDVDPSLPTENGLIIDSIGVRGEIHEGEDWENILRQGIWRVPDFGAPHSNNKPIILAAHRWGYLEWSASFRKLNSFYSLPKVKVGDTIKIVWDQREFSYTVYATGSGTEIEDYTAKLILYTCQLWNSPLRYFVYANPAI